MALGKIQKWINNNKKSKTEKFKLLLNIIKKIQILIIDLNNITVGIKLSFNLKSKIDIINQDNLIRKNISNMFKKVDTVNKILKNFLSDFKIQNIDLKKKDDELNFEDYLIKYVLITLKNVLNELKPLNLIYDNKNLLINKIGLIKSQLENIERKLINLEKYNLEYFESIDNSKNMISSLLQKQNI